MSFLAPEFLWIGFGVSAVVTALHFIVTRQPLSEPLPTARFVPDIAVQAVSRSTNPSDLLLLLLRLLAIMSIAAAFAGPVIAPKRQTTARIILADISGSSANLSEVRDSAKGYFRPGDIIIGYDSTTREVLHPDSIVVAGNRIGAGSLSAAMITALRTAPRFRERADSISLIAISSFPSQSWDAATDTIRTLWPGSVQLVPVAQTRLADTAVSSPRLTVLSPDDPLGYAMTLASKHAHPGNVVIVRSAFPPTGNSNGLGALLHWPASERPRFAVRVDARTHGALIANGAVVVSPFSSSWEFPADSIRGMSIIARWEDGSPAAVQRNESSGCVRSVAVPVTSTGDLVIRPEFVALVQQFISPCTATPVFMPAGDAALLRLKGGTAAAPRTAFQSSSSHRSPYAIWLFVSAILLLITEQVARRTGRRENRVTSSDRQMAAA